MLSDSEGGRRASYPEAHQEARLLYWRRWKRRQHDPSSGRRSVAQLPYCRRHLTQTCGGTGVGIVGKEGKQASLAADFSVTQFSFLTKLLLWHGRNSYRRSAKLAQFVIHRGLIISVMQAVFSSIFYFAPIAIYQGMLLVGYATAYTMAPVFSLVLDRDVSEDLALLYPELYKELTKGRVLSYKTFFVWLMISVYQGMGS